MIIVIIIVGNECGLTEKDLFIEAGDYNAPVTNARMETELCTPSAELNYSSHNDRETEMDETNLVSDVDVEDDKASNNTKVKVSHDLVRDTKAMFTDRVCTLRYCQGPSWGMIMSHKREMVAQT